MSKISINGRILSNKNSPYIIAEISANHNGSVNRAKETIRIANEIGVDAVKIQSYTPETMTINSRKKDFLIKDGLWRGRTLYDLYSEAYTPFEWHEELFEYAQKKNITLFSTPFDETAVDLLETLDTPAYKIASFELVDLQLIKYVAEKKKPLLLSTGMASSKEITEAINVAKNNGAEQIGILHCISSYPTKISDANLLRIRELRQMFNLEIGLSDHTIGSTASLVATTLGASFIEKHFTLDKNDGGPDSAFSLDPKEMSKLVTECKNVFLSLGNLSGKRPKEEKKSEVFRRSLYFVKDLPKNSIISSVDVKRIRPGYGLSPKYLDNIIGKRVIKNVKKGDRVTSKVIKNFRPDA